ncbi:glucose-1-phosphate adenylyltransferase subunit GlgD [Clostridia bacterium]|nr:glucose-1-phosphate adenylyltransferase subunit GlgD [Clostridia bacterium]
MIREAFGMIYASEEMTNLRELVDSRAVGALPVGGKYRVLDFPLSNMVNSDIRNVGVITSRNYNSLMDHLGSGKAWDLSRKSDGLFILTPFSLRENPGIYRGKVEALRSSMDYIRRAKQEYVVLTGATFVYNLNFDEMMRYHIESGADLTVLYRHTTPGTQLDSRAHEVLLDIDPSGRVTGLEVNPVLTSLGAHSLKTYIVRKDILIYLVDDSYSKGEYKFSEGLLRSNLDRLRIMGFEHTGYVGAMRSVASYYKVNMEFLREDIRAALFPASHPIYTKTQDSVPTKYISTADTQSSLIANGCVLEGRVENSVIFRNVHVGKDAVIKDSIVLPNTVIAEGAELDHVILDKNVRVRARSRLVGNADFPVVIRKGGMV